MNIDVQAKYKELFPDLDFELSDYQTKSVNKIVNEEKNTLSIIPTGGGKSLIYWLSGRILEGMTIVISPLIALMEEQAEKLSNRNCSTLLLHGQVNSKEQAENLIKLAKGEFTPDFIFVSPERLATDGMLEYCFKKRNSDIKLIVIDEVHCVSQWGDSFRPFYKRIKDFINNIYENDYKKARVLALTATINPKEIEDICKEFEIEAGDIVRDNQLMRREINLNVFKVAVEEEKEEKLWNLFRLHQGEKILVYDYRKNHGFNNELTKRSVEDLSKKANDRGFNSTYFHGDMSAQERIDIINRYKNNEIDIIFATNAFGMGIDIPDIRVVVHFMIPESIEQYYQEIGRAARDNRYGGSAISYLLYSNKNISVKKELFIGKTYPTKEDLIHAYDNIAKNSTGLDMFYYFDNDEKVQKCLPYFLQFNLIELVCKGVADLKHLDKIEDEFINNALSKTRILKTPKAILSKNPEIEPKELMEKVYDAVIYNRVNLLKPFTKVLLINIKEPTLPEETLNAILDNIQKKKEYRNGLLDYFVYILDQNLSSMELHQQIAYYLGADKFNLNAIYSTSKGDLVRSKSEVIIANLLYEHGINYKYEEPLITVDGQKMIPDFTIYLKNGEKLYWEHLGMIGIDSYDSNWLKKLEIYNTYYKNKLLKTYESLALTEVTLGLIKKIKELDCQ